MPMERFRQPALKSPNRKWVISELDKLREEWAAWAKAVGEIVDHPYNSQTHSDVFADGEANMHFHDALQAKTLTFLNNNIDGHGFINGFDGNGCDRTDLRLKHRVKHRLHALDTLRAALQYAQTPTPAAPRATPDVPRRRVRSFLAEHWRAAVRWVFGIVAAVIGAYLIKLLVG